MKLSAGFATLSLLLAAAAAVEASSLHDAAFHKRQAHCAHRTSSSATPTQSPYHSHSNNSAPPAHGGPRTIQLANVGKCNVIGATTKVGTFSGPNGHIDWLNCGINDGTGWEPAYITIEELVVAPLNSTRKTTFAHCSDEIIGIFYKYGQKLGIPPIFLASFAMQESGCNPTTVGGAGEQGLMQITPDKCKGAPNGNCKDPDFNVKTAAAYFASVLLDNCGDILVTIGQYNGWKYGMTYSNVMGIAQTCCACQSNLDYIHQFVNGWLQGVDAYKKKLGKYHNVDNCH